MIDSILLNSQNFNGNTALDGPNFISIDTVRFTLTNPTQLAGTGMKSTGAGDWLMSNEIGQPWGPHLHHSF